MNFKCNLLLRVVSILMIIGGVFGLIGVFSTNALVSMSNSAGVQMPVVPTWQLILSGAVAVIELVIAILALMSKAYKVCFVGGILMLLNAAYGVVTSFITLGFTATAFIGLISFIIPVLYLWGLYQSKN